jgi:serine/threonine protein phosphatase PrpC
VDICRSREDRDKCQDRYRCRVVESKHGQVLIAIVSDGAGSASEGAQGAEYVCNELMSRVEQRLPEFAQTCRRDRLIECVAEVRQGLIARADKLGIHHGI